MKILKYFYLLIFVKSEYIFHVYTNKLLGVRNIGNYKNKKNELDYIAPKEVMADAIDFKIEKFDKKSGTEVKIIDTKSNQAISINKSDDKKSSLVLSDIDNSKNENFSLALQENNTFVIKFESDCVLFNKKENMFETGKCEDLNESKFELRTVKSINDFKDPTYQKKSHHLFYEKDKDIYESENSEIDFGDSRLKKENYLRADKSLESSETEPLLGGYPIYSGDRYIKKTKTSRGARVDNYEIVRKDGKIYTDEKNLKTHLHSRFQRNRQLERKNHSRSDARYYKQKNIFGPNKPRKSTFSKSIPSDDYSRSEIDESLYFD